MPDDEVSIQFNTIVLQAGDLNTHHPDLSESINTNRADRLLQRFATVNALSQVIRAPTRITPNSSSCLDIMLTNIPEETSFLEAAAHAEVVWYSIIALLLTFAV
ncbi:hypothetical protein CAPTEDRAFT_214663 [Capitella teleta]|uniref:Endonuclease/exonuclease/phosphatase domain-containing protein n=1 Tax=Capitella teleta TaxID=283909 RepID=R7UF53_CAPTE|nr:hypothetical protein CAPTEDRAFT_214663 [Capitella teleta]|eukprot:ELU05159.1 hypothetical protein CAPTEDRAFT_214663 [Capitella teleta]